MPVTRSASSIPHSQQPFSKPSPAHKRHHAVARDLDTISLTSSDAEASMPLKNKNLPDKPSPRARPKKSPFVPRPEDIIEISSDDEDSTPQAPVQPSIIADFRRQISRMREESMKHKRDFERASKELKTLREENQHLKVLQKPDNKVVLETSQLSDHLDCEICTCRMWTPYLLPDCGHSFCQTCLQDWFGTAKTQYLAAHPQPPEIAYPLIEILHQIGQNPHVAALPYVQALITSQMPARPVYTCPTCREQVSSRPIEAFALKGLIYTISAAAGEVAPKSAQLANKKGKGTGVVPGPWDGFFPPKKI